MNNAMSIEKYREIYGIEKAVSQFKQIVVKNKKLALNLINDQTLNFSTLFMLFPVIRQFKLLELLSLRNKTAFNLCNQILEKKKAGYKADDDKTVINALEWIIKSADQDDGIANDFDKVVDVSVAKLLNEYDDKNAVKPAVDLAFKRHKKKEFNHDLVWALFSKNNVNVLENIAGYMKSPDKEDNDFSTELLNNAVGGGETLPENNVYDDYVKWLRENSENIDFTGEGYNLSSQPKFFKVNTPLKDQVRYVMNENVSPFEDENVWNSDLNNNINLQNINILDYNSNEKIEPLQENQVMPNEIKPKFIKSLQQIEQESENFWDKFMVSNSSKKQENKPENTYENFGGLL